MLIAGLDISTKTGLAMIELRVKVPSIIVEHSCQVSGGKRSGSERVDHILDGIIAVFTEHGWPDLVVIEEYGFANKGSMSILAEIAGVIKHQLYTSKIPYITVAPGTLKKFVTGSGASKKDVMLLKVYQKFSFETTNDNIADALALAYFGNAIVGGVPGFTKAMQTDVAKLDVTKQFSAISHFFV